MTHPPLHALRLLLRLKRRRLEQLNERLTAQSHVVAAGAEAHRQAVAVEAACKAAELERADEIERLLARPAGFRPSALLVLRHVLDDLAQRTRAAAADTRRALQELQAAQQALEALQRDRRRAEQQIELLQERLARVERELELTQEDSQDEESEEASVARLLAGARESQALSQLEKAAT